MGVKSFFHELKVKISRTRLFKALVTESQEHIPKFAPLPVKSAEIEGGGPYCAGCVVKTTMEDGSYMRHKIDEVDPENYVVKFTLVEGDMLGDKYDKICYESKFEATEDGGSVIKHTTEYHAKGDVEIKEEDVKAQDDVFFKSCEGYLTTNPHVCN